MDRTGKEKQGYYLFLHKSFPQRYYKTQLAGTLFWIAASHDRMRNGTIKSSHTPNIYAYLYEFLKTINFVYSLKKHHLRRINLNIAGILTNKIFPHMTNHKMLASNRKVVVDIQKIVLFQLIPSLQKKTRIAKETYTG